MSKTAPITIRLPIELKDSVRILCQEKGIDTAQYIRQLIERDLFGRDTLPAPEKKYIDRAIEIQTQKIIDFLGANVADKLNKICYNMGTKYDQATQKSEDLYAYLTAKFNAISRQCPDSMDARINQYRNEFMKNVGNWDRIYESAKKGIDIYVQQCDCLYKAMDFAAMKCKEENIINIFVDYTLHDWKEFFNKYLSNNISYNDIFETKIKSEIIDNGIKQHKQKINEACISLEKAAGIENSELEEHKKYREYLKSKMHQAQDIDRRETELRNEIKQNVGMFGRLNNMTVKRWNKEPKK